MGKIKENYYNCGILFIKFSVFSEKKVIYLIWFIIVDIGDLFFDDFSLEFSKEIKNRLRICGIGDKRVLKNRNKIQKSDDQEEITSNSNFQSNFRPNFTIQIKFNLNLTISNSIWIFTMQTKFQKFWGLIQQQQ